MSDPIEAAVREIVEWEAAQMVSVDAGEIAAILRKHFAQQWQPISTAPKDRTEFLAWYSSYIHIAYCSGKKFYRISSNDQIFPTHWMPLPQPPKPPLTQRLDALREAGGNAWERVEE
jgi:hypothetical protein